MGMYGGYENNVHIRDINIYMFSDSYIYINPIITHIIYLKYLMYTNISYLQK